MRTFLLALVAATVLSSAANQSPFACDRSALSPEHRRRHFDELGPRLRTLVIRARELPDGYEFQFPGDRSTFELLAEWTSGEHLCCPFFDIALRLDREGGAAWIRLTGRPGTKDFIRTDFQRWLKQ
jgi:hypothetical protein